VEFLLIMAGLRILLITFIITCALWLLQFPSMGSTKDKALSKSQVQTARLVALGKLWADVSLFHPLLGHSNIDWDTALVASIPKVEEVETDAQYAELVNNMLDILHDTETKASLAMTSNQSETNYSAREVSRVGNSKKESNQIGRKLCRLTRDGVAVFDLTNLTREESWRLGTELHKELLQTKKQKVKNFSGIVFDMRRDSYELIKMDDLFEGIAGHLCKRKVVAPALRSRMYCGYAPEAKRNGGHYFSAYSVHDAFSVQPMSPTIGVPTVFLINSNTIVPMAVFALQSEPNVFIVSDGPLSDYLLPVDRMSYSLPGGIVAEMPLGEWVYPDGHVGFVADKIVKPRRRAAGDNALKEAILFAKSAPGKTRTKSSYAISGTETAFPKYQDMPYPSKPYRLLALFRIWSVFNYFFPYKYLMGEDWDQVLLDFIPRFEAAKDAKEYGLVVSEMLTHTHDSHVGAGSEAIWEYFGSVGPPVHCRIIEGKPVITEICEHSFAGKTEIGLGDIVKTVNQVDAGALLSERYKYIPASTPQSLEGKAVEEFLQGEEDTTVTLGLEDGQGKLKTVSLRRQSSYWHTVESTVTSDGDMFKLIEPGDLGYCDLRKLTCNKVANMFEKFKNTKGIIFDMRGYPNGTLEEIAGRLTLKEYVLAGKHSKPVVSRPFGTTKRNFLDEVEPMFETSLFFFMGSSSTKYTGKTVMLIDDRAISQAEQTGLFLKAANDTRFVGSATTGANGTVSRFYIPGGICISFTGEIICHPDGTQLQRRGLQPDIPVKPTIAGIRAGKDEVLEKAIEYLRAETVRKK